MSREEVLRGGAEEISRRGGAERVVLKGVVAGGPQRKSQEEILDKVAGRGPEGRSRKAGP